MKKKDMLKKLKRTDSSFQKGRIWTKLIVILALLMIAGIQALMFLLTETLLKEALIHLGIQALCVLLILSGKGLFVWLYALAMASSLPLAYLAYQKTVSEFYLIQMIFFAGSLLLMLMLIISKNARYYRRKLRNLKKDMLAQEKKERQPEPAEEIQPEEIIEVVIEPDVQQEPEPLKEFVELSGPLTLDLSYGHFSRFLVQYYPFVYLHPKFDPETNSAVQMCISAEGFDKESEELYSGTFCFNIEKKEENASIRLEYEDEMGRLCSLICADWLVMQKATFMKNGINISAELMKQLTEAFVLAKDAQKAPFDGFNKL